VARFLPLQKYLILFVCLISLNLTGCFWLAVGGAGGVAGVLYYKGRVIKEVNVYYLKVHRATISSLKAMGLPIIKDEIKPDKVFVESKFLDDTPIWITIEPLTKYTSKIYIRVGLLGDRERSISILKKILKRL